MCGHFLIPFFLIGGLMMMRRRHFHHYRGFYGGCHGGGYGRYGGGYGAFMGGPGGHPSGWGGPFAGPWGQGGFHPLAFILEDLHLTPEQRKAADEIIGKARESAADVRKAVETARGKLGEALRGDGFNEQTAGDLLGTIDASTDKLRQQIVDALARLHDVLDPSQRARLADWIDRAPSFRRSPFSL